MDNDKSVDDSNIIKTEYGEYQLYRGDIWISKDTSKGFNIAERLQNGELRVLAYDANSNFKSLDEIVWSVLKSYGWYDEVCKRKLGMPV